MEAEIAIVESKTSYLQPLQGKVVAVCVQPDSDTVERFAMIYTSVPGNPNLRQSLKGLTYFRRRLDQLDQHTFPSDG